MNTNKFRKPSLPLHKEIIMWVDFDGVSVDGYYESFVDPIPNLDGTHTVYSDLNPYDGWHVDVVWDAYITY